MEMPPTLAAQRLGAYAGADRFPPFPYIRTSQRKVRPVFIIAVSEVSPT